MLPRIIYVFVVKRKAVMRKRVTKFEKQEANRLKVEESLKGTGLFVYENHTAGDLTLPKATPSGLRRLGPKERFQGDSYFMQFVGPPYNLLKFVEEIVPEKKVAAKAALTLTENTQMEKKLILDQPERVTAEGTVESVVVTDTPVQRLHDSTENKKKPEVLLTEDPLDGVEIILG